MKHRTKGELIRLPVLELRPNQDLGELLSQWDEYQKSRRQPRPAQTTKERGSRHV